MISTEIGGSADDGDAESKANNGYSDKSTDTDGFGKMEDGGGDDENDLNDPR